MKLDPGQWSVILLSAVLILGYIQGYYTNRRKAEQITQWLQTGLTKWGRVTPGEPLPGMASGGRLNVLKARAPFMRIEAVFLLEPRENILFRLLYRWQGRRDELVLRIHLNSPPAYKVVAGPPGDKQYAKRLAEWKRTPFQENALPRGMKIACANKRSASAVEQVTHFLQKSSGKSVIYFNLQPQRPHITLRAKLPELLLRPSKDLFDALQTLLLEVSSAGK